MRKENNQMRINKFNICIPGVTIVTSDADSKLALKNAAFSLLLSGRVLYLSALLMLKSCGKKAGAIAGWNVEGVWFGFLGRV